MYVCLCALPCLNSKGHLPSSYQSVSVIRGLMWIISQMQSIDFYLCTSEGPGVPSDKSAHGVEDGRLNEETAYVGFWYI